MSGIGAEKKSSHHVGKMKIRIPRGSTIATTASDSDNSVDTNSMSAESASDLREPSQSSKRSKKLRRGSEWEIMEGLKDGQRFDNKPNPFNGFLHKKRKWPLKGWHKRYFVLEKGILIYGKGPNEINKGKIHGTLDIGLSVISTKLRRRRIDIDAEEFIYHLKAKTDENFLAWVQQLTDHRLYRQHVLTYGSNIGSLFKTTDILHSSIPRTPEMAVVSRDGSLTRGLKAPSSGRPGFSFSLQEASSALDQIQRESTNLEHNISKLQVILKQIEITDNTEIMSPCVKKDRRKFGLKKKKSSKGGSVDLTVPLNKSSGNIDVENTSPLSTTALSTSPQAALPLSNAASTADNVSDVISLSTDNQLREDFLNLSKNILHSLKSINTNLASERERIKNMVEVETTSSLTHNVLGLKTSLSQALQQNADLRNRLSQVHAASDVAELSPVEPTLENRRPHTISVSSSIENAAEFFDAEEVPIGKVKPTEVKITYPSLEADDTEEAEVPDDQSEVRSRTESTTSLSSGGGSISSESELGTEIGVVPHDTKTSAMQGLTGRRTCLPVPRPSAEGFSLWALLSKNIGKDLSQISMPVALNEPLNILQRLCEELEYSELLDKAAALEDPYERMVQIAAFAVSAYGCTASRAANKPFNPLLGETYECIREDKGFKFISEQVSHHPPVSSCYAESSNFIFWQDARVKTKFWGKSMEFQPLGEVHVQLPKTGDLYSWNKVTTCVHNLFSNDRWMDQYGELIVSNGQIKCKLTFNKASYWSNKRHEVTGAVFDENGKQVHRLFGKWSESLYCGEPPAARCIWRAGTLPPNQESYYGFTQFAIELNELGPEAPLLPPTDSRFRPDQRALEEGDLNTAETMKMQLEAAQRDRRKRRDEVGIKYEPKWFSATSEKEDSWAYNGKYWECRKTPGFSNVQFETLW